MRTIQVIPRHLKKYVLKQDYSLYTPMDQAGWRFIMRLSRDFFKDHAHPKYLTGLPATGISLDHIPHIEDMDKCLKKLGWRAVVVSGFIPPAVFLEFLALRILPVACDMRSMEHLHYTPAPDIVHEAAGHAPILADPEYANYLKFYGEISQKVIFSSRDLDVYSAIRRLSEFKEDPLASPEQIETAANDLVEATRKNTWVSEATQLSRMAWWTIEYGLVGPMSQPLIYGAGLLSSVGESYDCYYKKVKKLPLTFNCINVSYDITKPQPQLFVTPNFQHLIDLLGEFSETMSYRQPPREALKRVKNASTVCTVEFENGLQLSGILKDYRLDAWERPYLLEFTGPCQLSFDFKELKGFGPKQIQSGLSVLFSNSSEYERLVHEPSTKIIVRKKLLAQSQGSLKGAKLLIHSNRITSVFGEAADRTGFYDVVSVLHEPSTTQKSNLTVTNKALNSLYERVNQIGSLKISQRAPSKKRQARMLEELEQVHREAKSVSDKDWLIRMEMLRVLDLKPKSKAVALKKELLNELHRMGVQLPEHMNLIERGIQSYEL